MNASVSCKSHGSGNGNGQGHVHGNVNGNVNGHGNSFWWYWIMLTLFKSKIINYFNEYLVH